MENCYQSSYRSGRCGNGKDSGELFIFVIVSVNNMPFLLFCSLPSSLKILFFSNYILFLYDKKQTVKTVIEIVQIQNIDVTNKNFKTEEKPVL